MALHSHTNYIAKQGKEKETGVDILCVRHLLLSCSTKDAANAQNAWPGLQ